MIEGYQILILGSMVAGYFLLRALEFFITSIVRTKRNKSHETYKENYDKFVEKVEEQRKKLEKRFNTDIRRLEKNE